MSNRFAQLVLAFVGAFVFVALAFPEWLLRVFPGDGSPATAQEARTHQGPPLPPIPDKEHPILPGADERDGLGHPLYDAVAADGPLLVGPKGEDAYAYPYATADKVALRSLLRQGEFERLEEELLFFAEAGRQDFHKERWVVDAFQAFRAVDSDALSRLSAWVRAKPGSWVAHLARAEQLLGRANYLEFREGIARAAAGGKGSSGQLRDEAEAAAIKALELAPEQWIIYTELVSIVVPKISSRFDRDALLEQQLERCPNCYTPHARHLWSLQPHYELSDSVEAVGMYTWALKRAADNNPRIANLLGARHGHLCWAALNRKEWALAETECRKSKTGAEHPYADVQIARALAGQGRQDEAKALLDQALARHPQDLHALEHRVVWGMNHQPDLELAELILRWIRLAPFDAAADNARRWAMSWLRHTASQARTSGDRETALRAIELSWSINPWFGQNCLEAGRVYAKFDPDYPESQLRAQPDSLHAHRRFHCLSVVASRADDGIAAWDRYIDAHSDDARAFYERAALHNHRLHKAEARADLTQACELGLRPACVTLHQQVKRGRM